MKTGRGGIRDIEYAVQFLQLLNGGDLPAVRQRNTLLALEALEIAGCLTPHETYILADAYRYLIISDFLEGEYESFIDDLCATSASRLPSGATRRRRWRASSSCCR